MLYTELVNKKPHHVFYSQKFTTAAILGCILITSGCFLIFHKTKNNATAATSKTPIAAQAPIPFSHNQDTLESTLLPVAKGYLVTQKMAASSSRVRIAIASTTSAAANKTYTVDAYFEQAPGVYKYYELTMPAKPLAVTKLKALPDCNFKTMVDEQTVVAAVKAKYKDTVKEVKLTDYAALDTACHWTTNPTGGDYRADDSGVTYDQPNYTNSP